MSEEIPIRLGDLEIRWVPGEVDASSALKQMRERLSDSTDEVDNLASVMDELGLSGYQLSAPEESPILFRFSFA